MLAHSIFPSSFFQYTNQSIYGKSGFNAWSIGISFPLFPVAEHARKKKASLDLQIADVEWEKQRSQFDATTANLLTDMNKLFETLNYYYDSGLKQSSILVSTAQERIAEGKVNMQQYIWGSSEIFRH